MSELYESLFRNVLFPLYEGGLRRRHTLRYLREYERDQWLPAERIAAIQWQKLQRLLAHCWNEVPYYRRRWSEAGIEPGDIRTLEDYARLPVLTKRDIRDNYDDMPCSRLCCRARSWEPASMGSGSLRALGSPAGPASCPASAVGRWSWATPACSGASCSRRSMPTASTAFASSRSTTTCSEPVPS